MLGAAGRSLVFGIFTALSLHLLITLYVEDNSVSVEVELRVRIPD